MELMAEEVDFVSITMSDYGGRYLKAQNLGELRQENGSMRLAWAS